MLAIVDGLTIVALSRYSKNDNTARQDPDHFGTYIYRSFFDARLRLSRLSPFLPILFFPRFLLFLPLFPRFNSFSTSPPPTGRGSKGSLVPTENKKVKFSCSYAALSLPYKNNATWHFQRGCLVSSCVLRLAFPRLYIFPRCFLFETLDERVYDFPFKSNRCFSSNCQPFQKSERRLPTFPCVEKRQEFAKEFFLRNYFPNHTALPLCSQITKRQTDSSHLLKLSKRFYRR